jgi:very-short-patch-repair endonuclease
MGRVRMGERMKGQTNEKILKPGLQRRLRKNLTDAEQRLWSCLRGRQMEQFKFRRQHPFGDYVIDFVCLEAMLAVEVDGGQHADSRQRDDARTKSLTEAGFKVLRFWNNDVLRDIEAVKETIWRALQEQSDPSPPRPM